MSELEMPQIQMLLRDGHIKREIEFLEKTEYQKAIDWIRNHFTFMYDQQIDWSHDPDAAKGNIKDLKEETLFQLLKKYDVELSRRLTVIWTCADVGIRLPLPLIAKHRSAIWLPVIDDVFILDIRDVWCLELYHEGNFSCGKYRKIR